MTPIELYKKMSAQYPSHVVASICEVETTCRKKGFCAQNQNYPVIDFDEVKNDFCQGGKSLASVDAVCASGKGRYFCFVELKGWSNYVNYLDKQKKTIAETAKGYNLKGKLDDSQEICILISGNKDLFMGMPIVFLLVTDITAKDDGMAVFADAMFKLAETSSDTYSKCLTAARKTLDTEIRVEHDYVYCKDFDKYIAAL